jgi:hypothetical protein
MDAEHAQVARIGLAATRDDGFALAGGQAFKEHGIGVREPNDVDLFTDRRTDFDQTMSKLETAYGDAGYQVDMLERSDEHAKFTVSKEGRSTEVDVGRDFRSRPPVETDVGPMLSAEDSVGSKVGMVYDRVEAKAYIDLDAAVRSGRYSRDDLLALGDARDLRDGPGGIRLPTGPGPRDTGRQVRGVRPERRADRGAQAGHGQLGSAAPDPRGEPGHGPGDAAHRSRAVSGRLRACRSDARRGRPDGKVVEPGTDERRAG